MSVAEIEELGAEVSSDAEGDQGVASMLPLPGAVIGLLVGLKDDGYSPLVVFPGQAGTAAVVASTIVEMHGGHVGRQVVLIFENSDVRRPIIVGCIQRARAWPLSPQNGVEVDADGQRLVLAARESLVLRCGKASITLTKAGKVLIEGEYVSSKSAGVHRIKGGSIQLN